MLKVGTLVSWRGSVGLVMGPCKKRWAKDDDVYVKWTDESKLKIESSRFLEVLNASRGAGRGDISTRRHAELLSFGSQGHHCG